MLATPSQISGLLNIDGVSLLVLPASAHSEWLRLVRANNRR